MIDEAMDLAGLPKRPRKATKDRFIDLAELGFFERPPSPSARELRGLRTKVERLQSALKELSPGTSASLGPKLDPPGLLAHADDLHLYPHPYYDALAALDMLIPAIERALKVARTTRGPAPDKYAEITAQAIFAVWRDAGLPFKVDRDRQHPWPKYIRFFFKIAGLPRPDDQALRFSRAVRNVSQETA